MPEMEHFVIENVLDQKSRGFRAVENLADNNGIVSGVKMAQNRAGDGPAPAQPGASQQAVEVLPVELPEDFLQVEVCPLRRPDPFAPAGLPDLLGLIAHRLPVQELPVAGL